MSEQSTPSSFTPFKLAFGFAVVAIGATAIVTSNSSYVAQQIAARIPLADGNKVDPVVTGSIKKKKSIRYTVRRSVLQKKPGAVCKIFVDGTRQGDC